MSVTISRTKKIKYIVEITFKNGKTKKEEDWLTPSQRLSTIEYWQLNDLVTSVTLTGKDGVFKVK